MMDIFERVQGAPYHNNDGHVVGYKVDANDLYDLIHKLHVTENERDSNQRMFHAAVVSPANIGELLGADEHDTAPLNIPELLSELAELRAYKEAAEKQKPVQWVCELSSNPWPNGGGTRRDTKEDALKYINSDSNHCKYDTVSPIYRLPVPADKPDLVQAIFDASDRKAVDTFKHCPQCDHKCDKPSVAVPDEMTSDLAKDFIVADDEKEFLRFVQGFNCCRDAWIKSAPSDSQQSAEQISGWQIALKVREALDRRACPDAFMRVAVEEIERLLCPSHESEQGGAV